MENARVKQRHELRLTWDPGMGEAYRHLADMTERERRERFKFLFQLGFEAHRSLLRPGGSVPHGHEAVEAPQPVAAPPATAAAPVEDAPRVPDLNDLQQRFGGAMDMP